MNEDINRLTRIVEELRAMRNRLCESKNNGNQRYHSFSGAISFLRKAADDLRAEG